MADPARRPALSVVLVVHRMPEQALRTMQSLSPEHQTGVTADEYEVVVTENRSDRIVGPGPVAAALPNSRYLLRDEPGRSPAPACNAGAAIATGDHIALAVDGARMVSPGLVRAALDVIRQDPQAIVSVPGYHLGPQLQHASAAAGYGPAEEERLLRSVGWPTDGYRLFDIAVLSGSCSGGFLLPMAESNFLCLPRRLWDRLGGVEERFRSSGGGFVNLDLYRRAVSADPERLFVLPGEGTFHQFHGGATTGAAGVDRCILLSAMEQEYMNIRGESYRPPGAAPKLAGTVGRHAARFLEHSARLLRESEPLP